MSYGEDAPDLWDGAPFQATRGQSRRANGPRQSAPRSGGPRRSGGGNKPDLGSYVEVKDRIRAFYAKYPEGRIQSEVIEGLSRIQGIDTVEVTKTNADGRSTTQTESIAVGYIAVKAYAYRTPDDPRPATGMSAMLMPGTTPYTRGSELENAETSAWGRALANLDILNDHSIASRDEVSKARGGDDVDAEIAAAEAFAAAQAAAAPKAQNGSPVTAETATTPAAGGGTSDGDLTAAAAEILGAVPVTPEAPPVAGEAPAPTETATDTPEGTEAKEEATTGLTEQQFLDEVRARFIHSSIINKTRIALFPESKSYKDLTDKERLVLLDGCLESVRQDTKD